MKELNYGKCRERLFIAAKRNLRRTSVKPQLLDNMFFFSHPEPQHDLKMETGRCSEMHHVVPP